jgi:hypothetical protein
MATRYVVFTSWHSILSCKLISRLLHELCLLIAYTQLSGAHMVITIVGCDLVGAALTVPRPAAHGAAETAETRSHT